MLAFDPLAPFDTVFGRSAAFIPPVDVTMSKSDLVITMDVPGLRPDALDIEVVDGNLLVRGERARPELTGDATWTHAERAFGRFERRIKLPQGTDPDAITANFEHGVLSLVVPKPDRMKPRRITIDSGSERKELAGTAA
jgi:HSP20 family protein